MAAKGRVLTCVHVVAQALHVPPDTPMKPGGEVLLDFPLILPPSKRLPGRVIFWSPVSMDLKQGADIALLEINTDPPANSRIASLVITEDDLWGHSFRASGFPAGFEIASRPEVSFGTSLPTDGWLLKRIRDVHSLRSMDSAAHRYGIIRQTA